MKKKKIIMSWSEVIIEVGKTGANDAMSDKMFSVGTINDKSTTLSTSDGDTLEAKATGGVTVAEEEGEPAVELTYRVKEMDFDTEGQFTGAEENENGELVVRTNKVDDDFSLKVTPKNIGAKGLKARRTHVKFRPGHSEDEGSYVDVTHKILECEDGELYRYFRVKAEDKQNIKLASDIKANA
ncbi:MAG: hypothetical protein NC401_12200 [Ruminococcus sp.]|nr:hypothetical protein [Ruminococcus sp.]MCM1439023.1 hypothetical protein [Roseburia sp.]